MADTNTFEFGVTPVPMTIGDIQAYLTPQSYQWKAQKDDGTGLAVGSPIPETEPRKGYRLQGTLTLQGKPCFVQVMVMAPKEQAPTGATMAALWAKLGMDKAAIKAASDKLRKGGSD